MPSLTAAVRAEARVPPDADHWAPADWADAIRSGSALDHFDKSYGPSLGPTGMLVGPPRGENGSLSASGGARRGVQRRLALRNLGVDRLAPARVALRQALELIDAEAEPLDRGQRADRRATGPAREDSELAEG